MFTRFGYFTTYPGFACRQFCIQNKISLQPSYFSSGRVLLSSRLSTKVAGSSGLSLSVSIIDLIQLALRRLALMRSNKNQQYTRRTPSYERNRFMRSQPCNT
eukprot:6174443-Pleurochrysis_carterae.AAC.2